MDAVQLHHERRPRLRSHHFDDRGVFRSISYRDRGTGLVWEQRGALDGGYDGHSGACYAAAGPDVWTENLDIRSIFLFF